MKRTDTLYVTDMDGTLLGADSRISPASMEMLRELIRQGARITVATARTPATVIPLLQGLRLPVPAIVMTGAAWWNTASDEFENLRFFTAECGMSALEICRCQDIHPFVYILGPDRVSLDVYHGASVMSRAEESFYLERKHLHFKRFSIGTPPPASALGRSLIFFAIGERQGIERAAADLRASTECSVFCYPDIFNPAVGNLEIFAPGVSKARAVTALKEKVGAERVVVFGDNLNDLPMLEAADVAVAVGNALPEVKNRADIVIEPNITDSVPRFIASDYLH